MPRGEAALLARTAIELTGAAIGFDADRLLAASLQAPRDDFDEAAYVRAAVRMPARRAARADPAALLREA